LSNRSERRSERRSAPKRPVRTQADRRRTRYQLLVLFAIAGLILLAFASTGLVTSSPVPS
jgi:hypothetical protein